MLSLAASPAPDEPGAVLPVVGASLASRPSEVGGGAPGGSDVGVLLDGSSREPPASRASPIAATATTSSTPVTTGQPGGRRPLVTLDDATAGGVVVGGVAPSGVDGGGAVAPGLAVDRGAGPTRFASELVGSRVISTWARAVVPHAGSTTAPATASPHTPGMLP